MAHVHGRRRRGALHSGNTLGPQRALLDRQRGGGATMPAQAPEAGAGQQPLTKTGRLSKGKHEVGRAWSRPALLTALHESLEPGEEDRVTTAVVRHGALVPFDVLRPRAPLLDVTAGEGQGPLVRGQPWRWGRARRRSKGAAQRALVCTSMEREVLPKMAPILEENVLPAASCWASRPAEMERHQTEPVPSWTTCDTLGLL